MVKLLAQCGPGGRGGVAWGSVGLPYAGAELEACPILDPLAQGL